MNTTYFNLTMTAEQMKKTFKRLALQWHPDICKDENATRIMQEINAAFAWFYARVSAKETYENKTAENPDRDYSKYTTQAYIDSLESMINWIYSENIDRIPSITLELIGVFVWIAGVKPEDKDIREKIKVVGFQGSFKINDAEESIYMWKWTPEIRRFNGEHNIDTIRKHYGSINYKRSGSSRKQLG